MAPAAHEDYEIVSPSCEISRRRLLRWCAIGALGAVMPSRVFAAVRRPSTAERSLALFNTHTNEELRVAYWARGKYLKGALADLDHILRDHRTGEIRPIDPRLLDLVHALAASLDCRGPFHVISGYRSPETNAMLYASGRGVAKKSLHVQGKAVDLRLPGCELPLLRRAAMALKGGGVGYYPIPDFVHVDVGRVRYW